MKKKRGRRRTKYRATMRPQTLSRASAPAAPLAKTKVVMNLSQAGLLATQKEKYRYVLADLRQIGAIAGALFGILIILSFVLS